MGYPGIIAREQHFVRSGAKTVAAAGTAEPLLAAKTRAYSVLILANSDNTGNVYIGDSGVDSTEGLALGAGGSVNIDAQAGFCINLADIYIDVTTNGDGVTFIYLE